ncbi:hypothetical protein ABTE87_20435, partial [Acinetobacter baumannii]
MLAAPLGHNTPSFSVDDPIRAMFFFAGMFSFILAASTYIAFDKWVCQRLKLLANESWLQGGQTPEWITEKNEISDLA